MAFTSDFVLQLVWKPSNGKTKSVTCAKTPSAVLSFSAHIGCLLMSFQLSSSPMSYMLLMPCTANNTSGFYGRYGGRLLEVGKDIWWNDERPRTPSSDINVGLSWSSFISNFQNSRYPFLGHTPPFRSSSSPLPPRRLSETRPTSSPLPSYLLLYR